ncbi:MAG: anti sigma factor C-terminal domain-containing protein [Gudongella sp.]|nr:anti sigma factor C-terminal domain-containing protein [Gudongella sp.]
MNYKELLDRYKKDLLSGEEKKIIEQELEKYAALEEYQSEIFDKELDEEPRATRIMANVDFHDEETSKLKKSVNSKFRKIVLKSVLTIIALYIGVFYIVSGMVDLLYYDPSATSQSEEQEYKSPDFYFDMQAYVSLNMPGHSINSYTFQEPKGFGKYELSYSLRDLFTDSDQRHFVDISRNRLTSAMDGIFSRENRFGVWDGFEKIKYVFPDDDEREEAIEIRDRFISIKNEDTIRYLNELNPLSYISMSIVFDEDLNMKDFYNMNAEYKAIKFKWVGIRTVEPEKIWSENQPMHLIGFNPNQNDEPSSSQRPDLETYPFFYLEDMWGSPLYTQKGPVEALPEIYEAHFKSRLKYLSNQEKFIGMFDYNFYKTDFYNDALKYVDENGIKTYGVLAFGTANEFLNYIEEVPYDSIYINQVLPIKPNIYYD